MPLLAIKPMIAATADVYAIILAAGASSRLGRPKQMLIWKRRPLLAHAIDHANTLLHGRVIVVLGANAEAIRAAVELDGVSIVLNSAWPEGIATSIRAGLRALPPSAEAALFLLCDQPLIGASHLQTLLDAWRKEPTRIVASHYHYSVGVPALFPAGYFGELLKLQGDRGAKRLLMQNQPSLLKIALPEAELDIDNADDVNYLSGHYCAEE